MAEGLNSLANTAASHQRLLPWGCKSSPNHLLCNQGLCRVCMAVTSSVHPLGPPSLCSGFAAPLHVICTCHQCANKHPGHCRGLRLASDSVLLPDPNVITALDGTAAQTQLRLLLYCLLDPEPVPSRGRNPLPVLPLAHVPKTCTAAGTSSSA